jgi:hypothetical protein
MQITKEIEKIKSVISSRGMGWYMSFEAFSITATIKACYIIEDQVYHTKLPKAWFIREIVGIDIATHSSTQK